MKKSINISSCELVSLGTAIAEILVCGLDEHEILFLKLLLQQVSNTVNIIALAKVFENIEDIDKKVSKK